MDVQKWGRDMGILGVILTCIGKVVSLIFEKSNKEKAISASVNRYLDVKLAQAASKSQVDSSDEESDE